MSTSPDPAVKRRPRHQVAAAPAAPEAAELFHAVTPVAQRRLLAAALEAFAEHGFHGTTTRDIASRAKMSNAALYIHYRSKQDLLFEISLAIHNLLRDEMQEAFARPASPRERLANLVRVLVHHHARRQTASRVALNELRSLSPGNRSRVLALRSAMEQMIREALRLGQQSGEFHVADLDLTTIAVVSLTLDIGRWYHAGGRLSAHALADDYVGMVEALVGVQQLEGDGHRRPTARRVHSPTAAARRQR